MSSPPPSPSMSSQPPSPSVSSPLFSLSSSLISKSESDSFKSVEILQVLKDSMIVSSWIASQEFFTHKHTSLNLARRRFPAAVSPAPPCAIQVCHSLRKLSLNGLFIETSRDWQMLVKPPGITARSNPLSRNFLLTDSSK